MVGGLGVMGNDFHDRKDLTPNYERYGWKFLCIAMSLGRYIADSKGGVEWLIGQSNDDDSIDTYSEFVKDIDTVIMGDEE